MLSPMIYGDFYEAPSRDWKSLACRNRALEIDPAYRIQLVGGYSQVAPGRFSCVAVFTGDSHSAAFPARFRKCCNRASGRSTRRPSQNRSRKIERSTCPAACLLLLFLSWEHLAECAIFSRGQCVRACVRSRTGKPAVRNVLAAANVILTSRRQISAFAPITVPSRPALSHPR